MEIETIGSQIRINNTTYPQDSIQFDLHGTTKIIVRDGLSSDQWTISDPAQVTNISSTSIADLWNKLNDLK
jgi:hypothetical protein